MTNEAQQSEGGAQEQERYSLGYGRITESMVRRSASGEARFFLPYVQPDMSLLDCGCGPGTITVDLAQITALGKVIGFDISENQIEQARLYAAEQSVNNVEFRVCDIYKLPFPDESFDAVFSNNLFEHISDHPGAINEMKRVLKKSGVIGIRSAADSGDIFEPTSPILEKFSALFREVYARNGGDRTVGRRLKALLNISGFTGIIGSASYESPASPEDIRHITKLVGETISRQALKLGLATEEEAEEMTQAIKDWGEHPYAFMAAARGEAVGWKE